MCGALPCQTMDVRVEGWMHVVASQQWVDACCSKSIMGRPISCLEICMSKQRVSGQQSGAMRLQLARVATPFILLVLRSTDVPICPRSIVTSALELQIFCTGNVGTSDCLVNGARDEVIRIDSNSDHVITSVLVNFDNPNVGLTLYRP